MWFNDTYEYDHDHIPGGLHGQPPQPPPPPGPGNPPPECERPTPIPPPVPPVRYVPGMNVQEQLCNMAERVNTSINRWNQIQANCYKALDNVVGAAVNNDVYYAPDEVRYMEGYSEEGECPYSIVESRAVDKSGKPILCVLRPAFGNVTNSGARELITQASFITSAQAVITAIQATETRWDGTSFFCGQPGNSQPNDLIWVAGWNRNGVLRFFAGDVDEGTLRRNGMVDVVGPVFPVIKAGEFFSEVLDSMGNEPGAIQAIAWKQNGNKVLFSCGGYETRGLTPAQVAQILKNIGCKTAVITSYQTQPATAWDASPIAGTAARATQDPSVISVPGMTGGMTFLGELTDAPYQWSIPANCAQWVITKRPPQGWQNAFTTEVANIVQKLGDTENKMNSLLGQFAGENATISKLQHDVETNTQNIAELQGTVGGFDGRIKTLENGLEEANRNIGVNATKIQQVQDQLTSEINTRRENYEELTEKISQETEERKASYSSMVFQLNQEIAARESADTVLQNHIEEEASIRKAEDLKLKAEISTEATTRADADRNLQSAIEAEQSARSTKDTQHEARMDAIEAQEQKDVAAIRESIETLTEDIADGKGLPIATTTTLGVIKVGENLTIEADGTLNAQAGGGSGGDSIEAGTGIVIEDNPTSGKKVISTDTTVVATVGQVSAVADRVTTTNENLTELTEKVTEVTSKANTTEAEVEQIKTDAAATDEKVQTVSDKVDQQAKSITNINTTINNIQDGTGLPVASATVLGAIKVGANLSISEDGTLSASAGEGPSGNTIAAGAGIVVEHSDETNVDTISIAPTERDAIASVANKADQSALDTLKAEVDTKATTDALNTLASQVASIGSSGEATEAVVESLTQGLDTANANIEKAEQDIQANTAAIAAAQESITTQGQQVTKNKDDIYQLKQDLDSVDDTATAAMQHAADAEVAAAACVKKAGDTMTGKLTLPSIDIVDGTKGAWLIPTTSGVSVVSHDNSKQATVRIATPEIDADAATKLYVDAADSKKVSKSGDTMTGTLTTPNVNITQQNIGMMWGTSTPAQFRFDGSRFQALKKAADLSSESLCPVQMGTPVNGSEGATKNYVDATTVAKQRGTVNERLTIATKTGENYPIVLGGEVAKVALYAKDGTVSFYSTDDLSKRAKLQVPTPDGSDNFAATSVQYVTQQTSKYLPLSGGTMTGILANANGIYNSTLSKCIKWTNTGAQVINYKTPGDESTGVLGTLTVLTPTSNSHAATKLYVDKRTTLENYSDVLTIPAGGQGTITLPFASTSLQFICLTPRTRNDYECVGPTGHFDYRGGTYNNSVLVHISNTRIETQGMVMSVTVSDLSASSCQIIVSGSSSMPATAIIDIFHN